MITLPQRPFESATTEVGADLLALYDQADESARILASCHAAARESRTAIIEAENALRAHLDKTAKTGVSDPKAEVKLLREIEDAKAGADDRLHRPRVAAAETALERSQRAVIDYARANIAALLEELRPEAELTTTALIKAREKAAAIVAGPQAARNDVVARVQALTACVHRGRRAPEAQYLAGYQTNDTFDPETAEAWRLATEDESAVPMPDAHVVSIIDAMYNPAAERVVTVLG